jgi:hypothetical protein
MTDRDVYTVETRGRPQRCVYKDVRKESKNRFKVYRKDGDTVTGRYKDTGRNRLTQKDRDMPLGAESKKDKRWNRLKMYRRAEISPVWNRFSPYRKM